MPDFIIEPISARWQQQLQQGTEQIENNPVIKVAADAKPGYPCRLSLQDAEPGEGLFLFSHSPFSTASPYRETGPVFVRENAKPAVLGANQVPEIAKARSIVVRAYDAGDMMVAARQAEAHEIADTIREFLRDESVEFVHLRAVVSGCFLCAARRM